LKLKIAAIAAVAAIALCTHPLTSIAAAQAPPQTGAPGPNWLHLTPDQQSKMKVRQQKMNADVNDLRNDKILNDAQKSARFQTLQQAYETDMMGMLTPAQKQLVMDQKAKFMKQQVAQQAHMQSFMKLRDKMQASLSPAQKKKIQTIQQADLKQFQGIKSSSIPEAEKAKRAIALERNEEKQINSILTPAQMADVKKMQAMMPTPQMAPPR
jgi:hypothetical protein